MENALVTLCKTPFHMIAYFGTIIIVFFLQYSNLLFEERGQSRKNKEKPKMSIKLSFKRSDKQ